MATPAPLAPASVLLVLALCGWVPRPATAGSSAYPSAASMLVSRAAGAVRAHDASVPQGLVDPALPPGAAVIAGASAAATEATEPLPPVPALDGGWGAGPAAASTSKRPVAEVSTLPQAQRGPQPERQQQSQQQPQQQQQQQQEQAHQAVQPSVLGSSATPKKDWEVHFSKELWDLQNVPHSETDWIIPNVEPGTPLYSQLFESWSQHISNHIMHALSPCNISTAIENASASTGMEIAIAEGNAEEIVQNASLDLGAFFLNQAQHGFIDIPGATTNLTFNGVPEFNATASLPVAPEGQPVPLGQTIVEVPTGDPLPAGAAVVYAPKPPVNAEPCTAKFLC